MIDGARGASSKRRPVVLVEHDPTWAAAFAAMARVLAQRLAGLPVRIEHVGSTSVTGLVAKPILDIDLVLPDERHLADVAARLVEAGYIVEGERGIPGRHSFDASGPDVPRDPAGGRQAWPRHNLYAGAASAPGIREHLVFRDILRGDAVVAARYGELKRALANVHSDDVDAYCDGKTDFIRRVLAMVVSAWSFVAAVATLAA